VHHDIGCDPFDEYNVAELINQRLTKAGLVYQVEPPDTGRRWMVVNENYEHIPEKRVYNVDEVKAAMPDDLLKELEKINDTSLSFELQ
jgi:hypothetical protein